MSLQPDCILSLKEIAIRQRQSGYGYFLMELADIEPKKGTLMNADKLVVGFSWDAWVRQITGC